MHVAASTGRMVAGRYLLQTTIGRGAMGTVWRARDTVLDRDVAVKEVRLRGPVPSGSVMTEEIRILHERTLREARTAARLNHPAVVTVFDVVEADGSPWIVMELVEAPSLDQVLTEDGPLRPHQVADLGTRVLGALACAHAAGILHRDVKPSNVLLGPGSRAVLTDFGIATLEGDSGLTQAGMVMGTPGFTAPERIRGDPASPASDLWSLGATLYAAVEGRGPFDDRGNSIAILAAIANSEAPRPRAAGPLRPVIEALLNRDPLARPDAAATGRLLAAARIASGTVADSSGAAARPTSGSVSGPGAPIPGDASQRAAAGAPVPGAPVPGAPVPGDAGRQPASAGAPLLTAPLGLAMAGPETQVPAGEVAWPGAPRPDGPWPPGPPQDVPWPGGPPPGGSWPGTAWPASQRAATPWPDGPPPDVIPPRGGSRAGRHGARGPGTPQGLAAELAAMLPRGRRGLLAAAGALAIVAAGILAGVTFTHGGGGTGDPPGAPGGTTSQAGSGVHDDGPGRVADHLAGGRYGLRQPGGRRVDPGHPRSGGAQTAPGQVRQPAGPGAAAGPLPRLRAHRRAALHLPGRERGGLAVHLAARERRSDGGAGHRVPDRLPGCPPGLPHTGIGARGRVGGHPARVPERAAARSGPGHDTAGPGGTTPGTPRRTDSERHACGAPRLAAARGQ